jgi:hypothetical protein
MTDLAEECGGTVEVASTGYLQRRQVEVRVFSAQSSERKSNNRIHTRRGRLDYTMTTNRAPIHSIPFLTITLPTRPSDKLYIPKALLSFIAASFSFAAYLISFISLDIREERAEIELTCEIVK